MDIGANIWALRERRGLSQQQLASMAGVTQAYISSVELGIRIPSMKAGKLIAETLGVNVDALYAENTCPQVHYLPVYWHSYYEKLGYQKGLCPNAEKYYNEVMSIPLYYGLTDDDVEDVIHAVKKVVAYYTKLK